MAKSELYKAAGVDIDLATNLLGKVKADLAATRRPEMLSPIGGFGGLFQIDLSKYEEPVMVASIDGVGTKLMIAAAMEKYDTVGYDIVNHCINDINKLARGDFDAKIKFGFPYTTMPAFVEVSESFNKMASELRNVELLRADFINNFSHEFKTPIVSIAGFAQMLRHAELTDEEREEYLCAI